MQNGILGAFSQHESFIENLPQRLQNNLYEGLEELKRAGVEAYGHMVIGRKGIGILLTNSKIWDEAHENKQITQSMITHMSWELSLVKKKIT